MRNSTFVLLGVSLVASLIAIECSADEITCADGKNRSGLVLKYWPGKSAGLVVSWVPFRGLTLDRTPGEILTSGTEADVWGQKCDVVFSPPEQRTAMIREWRKCVPVATVTTSNGKEVVLIRTGIGVGLRNALVCMGYCGRSRVFKLASGESLQLKDVTRLAFGDAKQSPRPITYTTGGKHVEATLPHVGDGRHYFVYGFVEDEPGQLTDTEVDVAQIREIVMGH